MKKLIVLTLALLMIGIFAGCSPQAGTQSSAPAESSSPAESASDDYASWTSEEWNAASDQQQKAATEYVLTQVGELIIPDYQTYWEQADQEVRDENIAKLQGQFGEMLEAQQGTTLGDFINASREAAEQLAEAQQ